MSKSQLHRILNPLELSWLVAVVGKQELPRKLGVTEPSPDEQLRDNRVQLERVSERQHFRKRRRCDLYLSRFHYLTVGRKADGSAGL